VPRHGSGRPLHLSQLGSTPHDRVTSPQIRSSHSLPLDRPRQDASRHPPVVTNRPTTYRVRREPPLIQQPIHHPPACSSASTPFTHFIRGTQIPIAQDATPTSPSRGFLPWRFAYAGPPVHAAPPSWVRHPQTFTITEVAIRHEHELVSLYESHPMNIVVKRSVTPEAPLCADLRRTVRCRLAIWDYLPSPAAVSETG
jgi:hypothetical protein